MDYPCIKCRKEVRPRQHAIACDSCGNWQHRTCDTGISAAAYRQAVRDESELNFICENCENQIPPIDDVADEQESAPNDSSVDEGSQSIHVNVSFAEPRDVLERSLQDPAVSDNPIADRPLEFELIPGGSQKGKDLLVDSHGYSYNVKETRGQTRLWRCSIRNSSMKCSAGARERNGEFTRNPSEHIHAPDPTRSVTAKILKQAKEMAGQDMFRAARAIVKDARSEVNENATSVEPVNEEYLVRITNRRRQDMRPDEPRDMDFEIDRSALPPNFYRKEVVTDEGRRHLIFATNEQLTLLKQAAKWYLDGTFKVVRPPFVMLFSIHAFVRRGECSKQIPLLYVFMSGRRAIDYYTVFEAIKRGVGANQLQGFVLDYEKAIWKALRQSFPTIPIQGCFFHWAQSVWRHVRDLGLTTEYTEHAGTYCYIRKLMCLPFLPAEHIVPTFDAMVDFNTAEHLSPLLDYIRATWIDSTTWDVTEWSVYGQTVRTNNDVEGWHRRLNQRAGDSPPFYVLTKVLFGEAEDSENSVRLVSELSLRRLQRQKYRTMQSRVFAAWDSYRDGGMSASALLKKMSTIYKPRLTTSVEDEEE